MTWCSRYEAVGDSCSNVSNIAWWLRYNFFHRKMIAGWLMCKTVCWAIISPLEGDLIAFPAPTEH